GPEGATPVDLERQLHRPRLSEAAVVRMWPILTTAGLLDGLLSVPALLTLAADEVLTDDEWKALERPRERRLADVAWTEDDVALLDEASGPLGPLPSRARAVAAVDPDEQLLFERALEDSGSLDAKMRADIL